MFHLYPWSSTVLISIQQEAPQSFKTGLYITTQTARGHGYTQERKVWEERCARASPPCSAMPEFFFFFKKRAPLLLSGSFNPDRPPRRTMTSGEPGLCLPTCPAQAGASTRSAYSWSGRINELISPEPFKLTGPNTTKWASSLTTGKIKSSGSKEANIQKWGDVPLPRWGAGSVYP